MTKRPPANDPRASRVLPEPPVLDAAPTRRRPTADQLNQIKIAIISGDPPRSTRFQKGQSGNPKGRPKEEAPPVSLDGVGAAIHAQASRMIKVRQDGESKDISLRDAIVTQVMKGALSGNAAHAPIALPIITKHEDALAAQKLAHFAAWTATKVEARAAYAAAAANGDPEPKIVHPDDIQLNADGTVDILGPTDAEEIAVARWRVTRQRYYVLLVAYDLWLRKRMRRLKPNVEQHGWKLIHELALEYQQLQLPQRLRFTAIELDDALYAYSKMSGRKVLELLCAEARKYGYAPPARGVHLPMTAQPELVAHMAKHHVEIPMMFQALEIAAHNAVAMARATPRRPSSRDG